MDDGCRPRETWSEQSYIYASRVLRTAALCTTFDYEVDKENPFLYTVLQVHDVLPFLTQINPVCSTLTETHSFRISDKS